MLGLFTFLPTLLQRTLGLSPLDTAWLFLLWSGLSFVVALQAKRLAGRISSRHQLALGFALHAAAVLTMLGAVGSGSWTRVLPGLVIGGVGSGLLNAALPLVAVQSVPAERAAMGSGAQQTFRYIGSCAGVALTIALVTSGGGSLAHGANVAAVVSAGWPWWAHWVCWCCASARSGHRGRAEASTPHTTSRYREVNCGVQVVRVR